MSRERDTPLMNQSMNQPNPKILLSNSSTSSTERLDQPPTIGRGCQTETPCGLGWSCDSVAVSLSPTPPATSTGLIMHPSYPSSGTLLEPPPSRRSAPSCTPSSQKVSRRTWKSFETFCNSTSLHGWRYLSSQNVNLTLKIGWVGVVLSSMGVAGFFLGYSLNDFVSSTVQTTQDTSRASLDKVFFPSVTLCNINQGRRSFFLQHGLNHDSPLLHAVLGQAYFGLQKNLSEQVMTRLKELFSSEEVMRKGIFTDMMYMRTTSKEEAKEMTSIRCLFSCCQGCQKTMEDIDKWQESKDYDFINEAGWYFKTLAAQEPGENNVLLASYGKVIKDTEKNIDLLPFFGTDYGLCSLIKPQISFNASLDQLPFEALMTNYSRTIKPGIQLGKENGLTLLLDAEVYDYAFSPQRGEGFKLAIHSHMDQPIMALSDIDLSPGFVTQLSVTPTLRDTTDSARWRFNPVERGCYFDGELEFKYLPSNLYRYGLSNCLFAATYDQILEKCKCVPFFHTMAYDDYPRICSGQSLWCMNNILRDIGSHTHVKVDENGVPTWKPCLFACKDQSFTTAVTQSTFPNMHTFVRGPEFCLMIRKLKSSCVTSKNITLEEQYPKLCQLLRLFPKLCASHRVTLDKSSVHEDDFDSMLNGTTASTTQSASSDEADVTKEDDDDVIKGIFMTNSTMREPAMDLLRLLHRYARENLLLANIYIKDPAVTLIKRDQKIPIIWFIANIGGILGLCMGCSLVTLFEVGHHILLIFLKTGKRSVNKIQRTIRLSSTQDPATKRLKQRNIKSPYTMNRSSNGDVTRVCTDPLMMPCNNLKDAYNHANLKKRSTVVSQMRRTSM